MSDGQDRIDEIRDRWAGDVTPGHLRHWRDDAGFLLLELDCAEMFIAGLGGQEAVDRFRKARAEMLAREARRASR